LESFEHPDGVVSLVIDNGVLFTAGWDGIARAWDARRGKQLLSFGDAVTHLYTVL
jgi:hypothetical protein